MTDIEKYNLSYDTSYGGCVRADPSPSGQWVRGYEHDAALAARDERIKRLEADAARYQWLRKYWVELYQLDDEGHGVKPILCSESECLDELIDAALKEAK